MSPTTPSQPILVCYDGSPEAERGLDLVLELFGPSPLVVLAVWQSLQVKLAQSASFGIVAVSEHETFDEKERQAAEALVAEAAGRAEAAGHRVTARVEESPETVWRTVLDVADDVDAATIVSGTRGRGAVKSALLGSVSHQVLAHSRRPVLIAPRAA